MCVFVHLKAIAVVCCKNNVQPKQQIALFIQIYWLIYLLLEFISMCTIRFWEFFHFEYHKNEEDKNRHDKTKQNTSK